MTRAQQCDRILAGLFTIGSPAPSDQQIFDAYPYGERRYHPYKVWLARVRAWKLAHAKGMAWADTSRTAPAVERDRETMELPL